MVCGGDGTVREVCAELAGTGIPVGIIPAGTGNLLARNLDIPLEVPAALDLAFGDERRSIDVLEAGDTRFVVMAGLGFDAAMIRHTGDQAKSKHGWTAYISGGLRALRSTPHVTYGVTVDAEQTQHLNAIGVVVGNVGRLQAGISLLPDADPADGLLDVIVLQPRTWLGMIRLAWNIVRRRPDSSRQAQVLRGQRVEIRAGRPVPAQFDGEYAGERDSLTVTVLPRSVTLCAAT
jgi:diacylglycerol kinase family enzyme